MNELSQVILLTTLAGAAIPLGTAVGVFDRVYPNWLDDEFRHSVIAFGGPGSLYVVGSEEEIEAIAKLGVALLLFSLGLEFSIERLKKLGVRRLIGGVVPVVLTVAMLVGVTSSNETPKKWVYPFHRKTHSSPV